MKKLITMLATIMLAMSLQAQSPEKMSYQAVVRNTKGELVMNQNVGMKLSILYIEEVIYSELQSPTTNENGLLTIEIGTGKVITGAFSEIKWAKGIYFLRTEIDPEGKERYTISSTTQLLSVPYSFYSSKAGTAETATSAITSQTSVTAETANKLSLSGGTYIPEFMVDIDGNLYATMKIGTQVWMVENLKVTHYSNGEAIQNETSNIIWKNLTNGAWCDNSNLSVNGSKFGHLYNWFAIADPRKIAPEGWHVATDAEWTILENYLIANGGNWDGTTTGNKISQSLAASTNWKKSTTEGSTGYDISQNNSSGFAALPGGYRFGDGTFFVISTGYWWSSTEYNTGLAWFRSMSNSSYGLNKDYITKTYGFSVRCVRD